MFRVALGRVTIIPSSSRVKFTWHPSREVSVRPKAMSSMSFSSSYKQGRQDPKQYFEAQRDEIPLVLVTSRNILEGV